MSLNCLILVTAGFRALPPRVQAKIIDKAMKCISKKTDFIVFDPYANEEIFEDEGRSLRVPLEGTDKTVYAKLDDYGSPENLSKRAGMLVDTQYVLTFLLAEEY